MSITTNSPWTRLRLLDFEPMLATGGSATATAEILKRWGVTKIKFVGLIGAPEEHQKKAMQNCAP
ncbi:MAG: uracil phosphoribosyltransferase [Anaerolineales bacterium]